MNSTFLLAQSDINHNIISVLIDFFIERKSSTSEAPSLVLLTKLGKKKDEDDVSPRRKAKLIKENELIDNFVY